MRAARRSTGAIDAALLPDAIERAMDDAGFETAHIAGNSLGGYLALQLAARGRARSVVALAPAGGWAKGDDSFKETLDFFPAMQEQVRGGRAARGRDCWPRPRAGASRRCYTTTNFEHIPAALLAHQMRGVASCDGASR